MTIVFRLMECIVLEIKFYVIGFHGSTAFLSQISSADGSVLWTRNILFSSQPTLRVLTVDLNGFIYVIGDGNVALQSANDPISNNYIDGFTNLNNQNVGFLLVFDSDSGSMLSVTPIQSTTTVYLSGIVSDNNGFLYLVGSTWGPLFSDQFDSSNGQSSAFLTQFSVELGSLILQWGRQFQYEQNYQTGMLVSLDNLGGVYVSTIGGNDCNGNYGQSCYYAPSSLFKFDINGNLLYSYTFPGNTISQSISSVGELISSGTAYSNYGSLPLGQGWFGFMRKQILNLNCSCNEIETLMNQVQDLLSIGF